MELIEILKRPEGKTLEFKRDLSSPTGLVRTATAFANTRPGAPPRGSGGRHAAPARGSRCSRDSRKIGA